MSLWLVCVANVTHLMLSTLFLKQDSCVCFFKFWSVLVLSEDTFIGPENFQILQSNSMQTKVYLITGENKQWNMFLPRKMYIHFLLNQRKHHWIMNVISHASILLYSDSGYWDPRRIVNFFTDLISFDSQIRYYHFR